MLGPVELNNSLYTQFARAQAFLPQQILGILAIMKFILEEFLIWFCRPCETLLRKNWGVRGFGLFQTSQLCVIGSLFGMAIVTFDPLMTLFCQAVSALAVYRRWEAVRAEKRNVLRYSWSSGEPGLLAWTWAAHAVQRCGFDPNRFITVSLICRFYEPGLVLVVGLSIRPISSVLSLYLIMCSAALLLKALITHNRLLDMKRDQIDARILSQWMASIHQTAGRQGEEKYFMVRLAEPPLVAAGTEKGMVDQAEPMTDTSIKQGEAPLIVFNCGMCSKPFRVSQRLIGKSGRCKQCGHLQVVRETQQA